MQWYKILARILLVLSVIDFALAAPVVVKEHEVRVSVVDAAKDGTATSDKWLANAVDQTNAQSPSDSGHWREQEPRQFNDSPEPSNPAPPIDPYTNNPPRIGSSPDRSPSFSSWLPADSHHSDSSSWSAGESWESLTTAESHSGSLDRSSQDKNNPDLLSTGESHPPSPMQIDHPPPAPPSEPGLSIKPHLPPAAESSDVKNAAMILMTMARQGFRPRTYGSGVVDAAKGELLGTIDTRVSMVGDLDKVLNVPATSASGVARRGAGIPLRGLPADLQNRKKSVSRGPANF